MTVMQPLLLGISGLSSSGKTTLSRLLRDVFPPSKVFILHLDDFYLTDKDIPIKHGLQDWDCVESLDLGQLEKALRYIKEHGQIPGWLDSKEDQNAIGEHGVPGAEIARLRKEVGEWMSPMGGWENRRICIIDGFLLFSEDMKHVRSLLDVKLFLRTSYETAKRRREARQGYVTVEGFWDDPPGYVDKIVWPNYVRDHKFLFRKGDIDDELDEKICEALGINAVPKMAEEDMIKCLNWALGVLGPVIKSI